METNDRSIGFKLMKSFLNQGAEDASLWLGFAAGVRFLYFTIPTVHLELMMFHLDAE